MRREKNGRLGREEKVPTRSEREKEAELLEKVLLLQLYSLGATQSQIAGFMGKSKTWVNGLLRGLPKKGGANASLE